MEARGESCATGREICDMSIRITTLSIIASVASVLLLSGCGETPEQKRISQLTQENEALRAQLNDRDKAMNDLAGRDESASGAVSGLRAENASLRDQLASTSAELARIKSQPPTVIREPSTGTGEIPEGKWVQMPGFDMMSISGEVLFESGKSQLKPAAKSTIDRIASDIRARYPDRDIFIFGHTDNEPIRKSNWKDNWQLGAERALTCTRELIASGIPAGRLIQANCGEFRPRLANTSTNNKRTNRRVEFYAVEKKGGRGLIDSTASTEFAAPTTGNKTTQR